MSIALFRYLKKLKQKAYQFEKIDINGDPVNSIASKYILPLVFYVIPILAIFLLRTGLPINFVSFLSTTLSIFVGLFITALIFSFDKFYSPIDEEKKESVVISSNDRLIDIQSLNFIRQFAYITGNTIVLSIYCIFILMISSLFDDWFNLNLMELYWVNYKNITCENIVLFIRVNINILLRFCTFYWILKILYNTLFIVSGLVIHMIAKIDRNDHNRRNNS